MSRRIRAERAGCKRRELFGGLFSAAGAGAAAALGVQGYVNRERGWEDLPEGYRLGILAGVDESSGAQREMLVRQWNRLHEHHQAEIRDLPPNADLQYNGMHAALQARDTDVDLVTVDIAWIAEFAEQGYLRRLEHLADDGFLRAPFQAGVIGGDVYALPFNSDVGLLYYRGDLMGEDDEPSRWSWEEFAERAEALTGELVGSSTHPALEGGIAMQLAPYEGFTVNVWEVLLSNGAEPVREDLIQIADDPLTVPALNRLQGMVNRGTVLRDSLAFDEAGSLTAFLEGRTIFLRHWPRAYHQLLASSAGLDVGVAPMPGRGVLGGQSLAVAASSRFPVASQALAEFLTGDRSQQLLFERGGFAATRPEPYEDADLRNDAHGPSAGEGGESGGAAPAVGFPIEDVAVLQDGLRDAGLRPAVDHYKRFSEVFSDYLHGILSNGEEIDAERLQAELEQAVEGK